MNVPISAPPVYDASGRLIAPPQTGWYRLPASWWRRLSFDPNYQPGGGATERRARADTSGLCPNGRTYQGSSLDGTAVRTRDGREA